MLASLPAPADDIERAIVAHWARHEHYRRQMFGRGDGDGFLVQLRASMAVEMAAIDGLLEAWSLCHP